MRSPAPSGPRLACLLFVGHPDDDAIFAGALQRRATRHQWTVVCVTHDRGSPRALEMRRWQDSLGTDPERVRFLGFPDDPEDRRQRRCAIDASAVEDRLRGLGLLPDIVITHNARGEYGHPHHRLTHDVAAAVYPAVPRLVFGHGLDHADLVLSCDDKWTAIEQTYASQRTVIASLRRDTETFSAMPHPTGEELTARLLGRA